MNRIKHFRQKAQMSQPQLAGKLNVDQTTVSTYENGRTPRLDRCREIVAVFVAEGLSVGLDDVFPPTKVEQA